MLRPLAAFWRSARPGRRWTAVQRALSLATGRGRRHVCVVHVDSNMHDGTRDEERLRRCPACFVQDDGFVGVCERMCDGRARALPAGGAA